MLTHLSLFSGIGGLDLAAEWAGFKTIGFVERDKYCQRVLAKHWPGVPIWDDVCKVTAQVVADAESIERRDKQGHASDGIGREGRGIAGKDGPIIGLISGGFPCQPHSVAGKRKASLDERDLWAECARIVSEFRPRWCVFENVPGLLSSEGGSFFARVLGDLAALGYGVGWATYGAVDVGAPHRRDRVFIVAHRDGERMAVRGEFGSTAGAGRFRSYIGSGSGSNGDGQSATGKDEAMADADDERRQERDVASIPAGQVKSSWRVDATGQQWQPQSRLGELAHGIPRWLAGPSGDF